jgi:hypothetical protein
MWNFDHNGEPWRLSFDHFNVPLVNNRSGKIIKGITVCRVERLDRRGHSLGMFAGLAECSLKDQFSRAKGRKVALERVRALLLQPGLERKVCDVFDQYCKPPKVVKESRKAWSTKEQSTDNSKTGSAVNAPAGLPPSPEPPPPS